MRQFFAPIINYRHSLAYLTYWLYGRMFRKLLQPEAIFECKIFFKRLGTGLCPGQQRMGAYGVPQTL